MGNRILALDLSTKRSGWATRANGELEYGAICANNTDVEKRICVMREEIIKLINKYDIDTIIVEDVRPDDNNNPYRSTSNHTGRVLMWLQGIVAITAYEQKKIKIEMFTASEWRSKLNIQGYRIKRDQQKQIDIEYVRERYGISTQDDEADAIGILDAYEKKGSAKLQPAPTIAFGNPYK